MPVGVDLGSVLLRALGSIWGPCWRLGAVVHASAALRLRAKPFRARANARDSTARGRHCSH
jgi:hypothetical protein